MPPKDRADAQRNRAHIVEVAAAVFDENSRASLNDVVKRAGVGPGTLYRHFPTREQLVLAVYRHDIEVLCETVQKRLARHKDDPLTAFREWFDTLGGYIRIKHGLGDALDTAVAQQLLNDTYPPVLDAISVLLDACEKAGAVRENLDPSDVLLVFGAVWRVPDTPDGRKQAKRVTDLIVSGLAETEKSPLR